MPTTPPDNPFAAITWRELGPWRGGRVQAVTGHPTDPARFLFGSTGGGVWQSDNAGATWRNLSDGFFRRGAVGAIAVATSDPETLYVGMGEGGLRNNVTGGDGVYRSRDGGATWTHCGLADTQNIARLRIDPTDPLRAYVAATGHRFGPNTERGVFRTRDGGGTWERVLFVDEGVGCADLSLDPTTPRYLYAAMWRAGRTPWGFTSGGPGSDLWRSTDGGDSWESLADAPGLPHGLIGRCAIAVSPADGRRVYALIEAAEGGGLYRSSDRGVTWAWVSAEPQLLTRPWYLCHLVADPLDRDTVYAPTRKLWKSRDGGRSWTQLNTTYWDQHDLWLDPADPRRMILGNDGGAAVSGDGGGTWSTILNQPTAELYHVAADSRFPYRVYGAQQDNSTISLPTRSVDGPISQADWFDVGGGESGQIAIRPDNPDIVYAASFAGEVTRFDRATGDLRTISVWPEDSTGFGASEVRHRFNWSTPVVISPHDPAILYIAGERAFRSTDEGASWAAISPDLTRADPTKGGRAGGPITFDSGGTDHYCTIMAFAESPLTPGVLWAGSDDGLVHLSRDGGASWADVTPPGVPEWANISAIEPSPHDPAAAYLAVTNHRQDDFRPLLFRTADWGATWPLIVADIPADEFCRTIRADPARLGLLFAGSEGGVYVSLDDGAHWLPFQQNLPRTPIYDLAIKDDDLLVATHGRGFWVAEDLTPLREVRSGSIGADRRVGESRETAHSDGSYRTSYFYSPRPSVRVAREAYNITSLIALGYPHGSGGPPYGTWFHYALATVPDTPIGLTILDGTGRPIRAFTSAATPVADAPVGPYVHYLRGAGAALATRAHDEEETGVRTGVLPPEMQARPTDGGRLPARVGLNRFVWDGRYPAALTLPGHAVGGITAPLAPPGRYAARLTIGDETLERQFAILPDPRLPTTPEEYAAQFALLLGIRDAVTAIHDAVDAIRDLRAEAADRAARLRGSSTQAERARSALNDLAATLDASEGALIQPALDATAREQESLNSPLGLDNKLAGLGYYVAKSDRAPTTQQSAVFADLAARVERELTRFRTLRATGIEEVNAALTVVALPTIVMTQG
jgi:photosystem II stability/assembly factor-like uncharacterized protein